LVFLICFEDFLLGIWVLEGKVGVGALICAFNGGDF